MLNTKIQRTDATLFSILEKLADEKLEQITPATELIDEVEQVLHQHLGKSPLSKDLVINAFNLSERSLNRHLLSKGTSFNAIRNRVLINAAKKALLETDEPISQIALWLGYSETSAFSRHFRRITGVSPRQYKRDHLQDGF